MPADQIQPLDPRERFAREVVDRLTAAGHTAYFAGGCVRDMLVGRKPKDFDVATNAVPDRIREIFGRKRTLAIGAAFGVISVLGNRRKGEDPIEVATFRSDGTYSDGRRPDSVVFSSPEEDAQRRDFTINGLFYDPRSEKVIDFVGGEADLQRGTIRAIGNAEARIDEDKLRMLRAVRFSATFGFQVAAETLNAIIQHADEIGQVSGERIGAEMRRLLACSDAANGIALLCESGLARKVFPALNVADDQTVHRMKHLLNLRAQLASDPSQPVSSDFVSGLGACLHPLGDVAAAGLESLTSNWRLANEEVGRIAYSLKSVDVIRNAAREPWSVVQPVLADRYAVDALSLAATVQAASDSRSEDIAFCATRLAWDREKLDPPHLINGNQLRQIGLPAGPLYKEIIARVRCMQLDGQLDSEDAAIEMIRTEYVQ